VPVQAPRLRLVLDGLTVMFLLIGLVPLVGLAVMGRWPDWEVGAGTAMSLLALRELARRDQAAGSGRAIDPPRR
jgi:hypothetical protein